MGVKSFHTSIDDDSEATEIEMEEKNDYNPPKTPYYGEKMNAYYDDEGNNDEDAPKTPYDGENINDYYNNEEKITRFPPTHLQMT